MQTKKELAPEIKHSKTYSISIMQRSKMGGVCSENRIDLKVKKQLIRQNKKGYVYVLEVLERKQHPLEGIRAMENDIALLQQKLEIQTDFKGEIIQILNLYPIKSLWLWEKQKSKFLKRHKSEKSAYKVSTEIDKILEDNALFTAIFKQSEMATLLFPALYQKPMEVGEQYIYKKNIEDFFSDIPLPLEITTTLKKHEDSKKQKSNYEIVKKDSSNKGKAQVFRSGTLAEEFDRKAVKKYFRKLADNYKLAVDVAAKYMETYDFDNKHFVDHAGQLLSVQIKGLFSFEQVVRVSAINYLNADL